MIKIKFVDRRTQGVFEQLRLTFVIKIISFLCNLWLTNLLVQCLGMEDYGVWATLYSVLGWIVFFDFGVANGLKNKVAEKFHLGKIEEARRYVATAYQIMIFFSLMAIVALIGITNSVGSKRLLGVDNPEEYYLKISIITTGVSVFLMLIFNLVNSIFAAIQKNALASLSGMCINIMFCVLLILQIPFTSNSFLNVSICYVLALLVSALIANALFYFSYRYLWSFRFELNFSIVKEMATLGFQFFIIQLYYMMLMFMGNYFILRYEGSYSVTHYNLIYKLFNTVALIFTYFCSPIWTYFTEAYNKKDIQWIKGIFRKVRYLFLGFTALALCLCVFQREIISAWVGRDVDTQMSLAVMIFFFHIIYMWNFIYSIFLYSISALNLDFYYSIFGIVFNLIISLFFLQ